MAKLADALDLGSSVRKDVWVQVPPSAQKMKDPQAAGLFHLGEIFEATSVRWFVPEPSVHLRFLTHSLPEQHSYCLQQTA